MTAKPYNLIHCGLSCPAHAGDENACYCPDCGLVLCNEYFSGKPHHCAARQSVAAKAKPIDVYLKELKTK